MMKVCQIIEDTIDNTYELTQLVKMSPKRDAKLHFIQVKNNSSRSNEDAEFVHGLKPLPPPHKIVLPYLMDHLCRLSEWSIRNFDELQNL